MQEIQVKKKFAMNAISMAVVVALGFASGAAMAAGENGIDLTQITNSFKASDVVVAVLAVAGVLAAIYATMTAAKMALKWIRGG